MSKHSPIFSVSRWACHRTSLVRKGSACRGFPSWQCFSSGLLRGVFFLRVELMPSSNERVFCRNMQFILSLIRAIIHLSTVPYWIWVSCCGNFISYYYILLTINSRLSSIQFISKKKVQITKCVGTYLLQVHSINING